MKNQPVTKRSDQPNLKVSHKAVPDISQVLHNLPDAVIQTDLEFNIIGWNNAAEQLHGLPGAMGKNLFQIVKVELLNSSFEAIQKDLYEKGCWSGEVIYHRFDGKKFTFSSTANFIVNERAEPVAIVIVNHNITAAKNTEKKLAEAEASYQTLVNTLVDGVIMMGADGKIAACNKGAAEILGFSEDELLGKVVANPSWKAIKPDGSVFPLTEFPAVVSLQTGFPQRNVEMGIEQPGGSLIWLSINTQALIRPGEFEPYAVVASFSNITDAVNTEKELRKSNERFYYVAKVTSDAIWDLDLETKEIYRSETFCNLSGYAPQKIDSDLTWWFNKVHPEDRQRVKNKLNEYMQKGIESWDDEYRFECADGNYKFLLDTGIILYRNGKPIRILGAIRDLTEKIKLEKQLLQEQEQKRMAISQASIAAQEKERGDISRELHDNVNQILMSAKLYMDSARNNPDKALELINKAAGYQVLAVEEIRKLSKKLNTSVVKAVGLKQVIRDVVGNLTAFRSTKVKFIFDGKLENQLTDEQKLMIFRIVQEQTNNIMKYADAGEVDISVTEKSGNIHLSISDNGKGFNPELQSKGIGFINIFNRADAFNGNVKIISSPGNGCMLEVSFPLLSK